MISRSDWQRGGTKKLHINGIHCQMDGIPWNINRHTDPGAARCGLVDMVIVNRHDPFGALNLEARPSYIMRRLSINLFLPSLSSFCALILILSLFFVGGGNELTAFQSCFWLSLYTRILISWSRPRVRNIFYLAFFVVIWNYSSFCLLAVPLPCFYL